MNDHVLLALLVPLGFGARIAETSDPRGTRLEEAANAEAASRERTTSKLLPAIDAVMFLVEFVAGWLFEGFVRSADATALIVTHNLALARRMDMLWFIDQGKLVEAGSPDVLLDGDGPTARHFKPRSAA